MISLPLPWHRRGWLQSGGLRWLAGLAWVGAMALLAWVLVNLGWRWLAPEPVRFPVADDPDPERAATVIAAAGLLGASASTDAAAVPARFMLHAVVAGAPGRPGYAVLGQAGQRLRVAGLGEEVTPGVVLERIDADRVQLRTSDGRSEVVPMARQPATRDAEPEASVPPPAAAAQEGKDGR